MASSSTEVELAKRAQKDLKAMDKPTRRRVIEALKGLPEPPANADVKALRGVAPWLRLRVGDWRILYRPLTRTELAPEQTAGALVARIAHRSDLDQAVAKLEK